MLDLKRKLWCASLVILASVSTNILLSSSVVKDNYKVDDGPERTLRTFETAHNDVNRIEEERKLGVVDNSKIDGMSLRSVRFLETDSDSRNDAASPEETRTPNASSDRVEEEAEKASVAAKDVDKNTQEESISTEKLQSAFVCVTGVLEQLELSNKVMNLFEPFLEANYKLDVAFILQTPPPEPQYFDVPEKREPYSFIRSHNGLEKNSSLPVRNESNYVSEEQIIGFLKNRSQTFQQNSQISVILHDPIINPPINLEYLNAFVLREGFKIEKKGGSVRRDVFEKFLRRTVTHVQMLNTYDRCSQEMEKNGNGDYDVIVRVGDEAIMPEPIQVNNISGLLHSTSGKRAMVVLPCQTTRGRSNNQIDFISSEAGEDYFKLPYASFYNQGIFNEHTVHNVGQYLQYIYQSVNITVLVPSDKTTSSKWKSLRPIPQQNVSIVPNSNLTTSSANSKRMKANSLGHPIPFPLSYKNFVDELTNGTSTEIPPINNNNNNDNKTVGREEKKRALLCITGQLARLDLDNKIETVVKPMQDVGYDVDVALVLSNGIPVFNKKPKNITTAFTSAKQVLDFLKSHNLDVVSEESTYVPNWNMPGNPEYLLSKNRGEHRHAWTSMDRTRLERILFNQGRAIFMMTESYTRCWRDAVRSGRKYDLYVRARDDVGFPEPIKKSIFEPMKSHQVVSSHCRNNGGINDRFAFVSPDSAECYFNLPFVRLYDGRPLGPAIYNTESMFKRVYWENNCTHLPATKELTPLKMQSGKVIDAC